jgi:hypothetical protein
LFKSVEFRNASLPGYELGNGETFVRELRESLEMAVEDGKKGIRL